MADFATGVPREAWPTLAGVRLSVKSYWALKVHFYLLVSMLELVPLTDLCLATGGGPSGAASGPGSPPTHPS